MPRIPDVILDSVIYLYPSVPAAESGDRIGGTGFLTSIPSRRHGRSFHYFVTNRHVIESGNPVIRLNRRDGRAFPIDATEREWILSPFGDDLAVCSVNFGAAITDFAIRSVPLDLFLTKEIIVEYEIGPGDDTFMVGRFINHEGRQRNMPSARFGNVAQMPGEPIRDARPDGEFFQESFLVEVHSIPGYSGSPVFVHIPAFSNRPSRPILEDRELGTWLLGKHPVSTAA